MTSSRLGKQVRLAALAGIALGSALVGSPAPAHGQATVRGRVYESNGTTPVASAQVFIVGTRQGATTALDGSYSIRNVGAGPVQIRLTRLGFGLTTRSVTVPTAGEVVVDFRAERAVAKLDEVVTTATGEQARRSIGSTVANIRADSVVQFAPITNVSELLTARVAGVQVIPSYGMTGGTSSIRIRGTNSIGLSNEPLWIIDGVRMNAGSPASRSGNGNSMTASIAPEQIESLDIIKGPAAAALYGTQAANGVIVIRTKRGKAGKTQWGTTLERGLVEQPGDFPDNYRSWGRNVSSTGVVGTAAVQCRISTARLGQCVIDSLTTFNPLRNPEFSPFNERTPRTVLGLSASGGSDLFKYYVSGEKEDETGPYTMPQGEIDRITQTRGTAPRDNQIRPNTLRMANIRGNFSAKVHPTAELTLNTGYTDRRLQTPFNASFFQGIQTQAIVAPGFKTIYGGYSAQYLGDMMSVMQPEREIRMIGSVGANWLPFEWLNGRATIGLDRSESKAQQYALVGEGTDGGWGPAGRTGGFGSTVAENARYTVDFGGSATWHATSTLVARTNVGAQWFKDASQNIAATGYTIAPGSTTLNSASIKTVNEGYLQSASYGAYIEEVFSHRERAYFTVGVRTDKNSAFGRDVGTTLYPRASLSYVISDEDFFPKSRWVNSLQLKAATGQSGVQPGATTGLDLLAANSVQFAGATIPTLRLSSNGNKAIRPEITTEVEFGAVAALLDSRLNVEATVFNKSSKDGLIGRPLATSLGAATTITDNIGQIRNRGYELSMDVDAIRTRPFSWNVRVTGSHIRNLVVERGLPDSLIAFATNRTLTGYPISGFWQRPITSFADANGDGIIVPSEIRVDSAWRYIGPSLPVREVGLTNNFGFLNNRLMFTTLFDYRGGHYRYWAAEYDRCSTGNCRAVNDPGAPLADQAAAVARTTAALFNTADGYILPGDFARFREASVSYTLPNRLLRLIRSPSGNVVVTGRNLGMLTTKYLGMDPENGGFSTGSNWTPPPLRYWITRFNLSY